MLTRLMYRVFKLSPCRKLTSALLVPTATRKGHRYKLQIQHKAAPVNSTYYLHVYKKHVWIDPWQGGNLVLPKLDTHRCNPHICTSGSQYELNNETLNTMTSVRYLPKHRESQLRTNSTHPHNCEYIRQVKQYVRV